MLAVPTCGKSRPHLRLPLVLTQAMMRAVHRPSCNRGFTLIEMLVATLIFLTGFVAVYGLFLAGMKFRDESNAVTRSAVAASSLVSEIRLKMGAGATIESFISTDFRNYPDQPGLFYRISAPPGPNRMVGGATKISLQFVYLGLPESQQSETLIRRRFGGDTIAELVERGIIQSYPAVIHPR